VKGKATTLPHRRRSSGGRACPVGVYLHFPTALPGEGNKKAEARWPRPSVFSLSKLVPVHPWSQIESNARLPTYPPADKCACANFIEGGGFLNKLFIRSMRCVDFGRISSTAYLGGGPAFNLCVGGERVQFAHNFLHALFDLRV